jgi:hypothetical protein
MKPIPVAPARTTLEDARYPYLVIRLMAAVYSVRPLPPDLDREVLLALAWSTMDALERRFRICLVLGPKEALYLEPDGTCRAKSQTPSGGINLAVDPSRMDFLPS